MIVEHLSLDELRKYRVSKGILSLRKVSESITNVFSAEMSGSFNQLFEKQKITVADCGDGDRFILTGHHLLASYLKSNIKPPAQIPVNIIAIDMAGIKTPWEKLNLLVKNELIPPLFFDDGTPMISECFPIGLDNIFMSSFPESFEDAWRQNELPPGEGKWWMEKRMKSFSEIFTDDILRHLPLDRFKDLYEIIEKLDDPSQVSDLNAILEIDLRFTHENETEVHSTRFLIPAEFYDSFKEIIEGMGSEVTVSFYVNQDFFDLTTVAVSFNLTFDKDVQMRNIKHELHETLRRELYSKCLHMTNNPISLKDVELVKTKLFTLKEAETLEADLHVNVEKNKKKRL